MSNIEPRSQRKERKQRANSGERKNQKNVNRRFANTIMPQTAQQKERSHTTVQNNNKKNNLFLSETNIIDKDMVEFPKDKWFFGPKCGICTQQFSKLSGVNEHHCRYCGKAVCGACSSKKINKLRVCDLCVYKKMNRKQELRRKEYLKSLNQKVIDMKQKIKKQQVQLQKKKKEIEVFTQTKEEEEEIKKDQIMQLQKDLKKATRILKQRKENNKNLKEVYAQEKSLVDDKDKEIQQLQGKINTVTLEIENKKEHYQSKLSEWKDLLKQKDQLEQSDSYQNLPKFEQTVQQQNEFSFSEMEDNQQN